MERISFNIPLFDKLKSPFELISDMRSMVQHSFVVQRSVTHLDLSLCELSKFRSCLKSKQSFDVFLNDLKFTCTEESCRKGLAPNRNVLYVYHLDVSKGLGLSLRNEFHQKIREQRSSGPYILSSVVLKELEMRNDDLLKITKWCSSGILVRKVYPVLDMYEKSLKNFIKMALNESNQKVKLIRQVSRLSKYFEYLTYGSIPTEGLNVLYAEGADSASVCEYLTAMNFKSTHIFTQKREIFDFLLYHANNARCDLWGRWDPMHASMTMCVFEMAESLFQYLDAPKYCESSLLSWGSWFGLHQEIELKLNMENGSMTRERLFLIMQIRFTFFWDRSDGLKALQMVWRSIPHPFITMEELTRVLNATWTLKSKEEIRSYITDIIGEDLKESGLGPRKLQHYCRIVIRGVLSNNWQLSTGIEKLELPPKVKSFLRLEN